MTEHAPRRFRGVLRRVRRDDEGAALVIVVGSMLVLAMFLMVGLAYAVSSTKFSRLDQDYTAAMTAAQSGIEDFISRLNRDDTYGHVPDCTNPALVNPTNCGLPYGWLPVTPGETNQDAPHFHYEIDRTRAFTEGTIMVTSTGRSNGVYRTIEAAVGKGGSTDFVYYTNLESSDPDNRVAYPSGAPSRACGRDGAALASYFWQGRSGCREIQFGSADVLDGRVHSNDSILSVGGRFLQGVESANPDCRDVVASNRSTWDECLRPGSSFTATGSSATFDVAPKYSPILLLPDNSAAFAGHPGCHYYGATRIIFNSNGTMTVWSKNSDFPGATLAIADEHGVVPSCGSGADLASAAGATVPVPSGMVVYAGPAPQPGEPGGVTRGLLYAGEIGGTTGRTLPLGSYTSSTPATPTALGQSYQVDKSMLDPRKYRGEGNIYIQGVLDGRVTVAAAQSIVVTGDLVLRDGLNGDDILGLVATNSVEVMHPRLQTVDSTRRAVSCGWWCTTYVYEWGSPSGGEYPSTTWPQRIADPSTGSPSPATGLQIAASIQTLQHSLFVQEYDWGRSRASNGDLSVRGSIAQQWRGAVGTAGSPGTGYNKDYRYDVRLRYTAPPYFPHWVNAQWSLRYSGEITTPDDLKSP